MRNSGRRLWTGMAVTGTVLVLAGAGWQAPHPATENLDAAQAVASMSAGEVPALPADFEAVMGYVASAVTGADGERRLIKHGNGCSSPFGPTSFDFSLACDEHDLGYDLLRYAAGMNQPLGPWARKALDARFRVTMHEHCDAIGSGALCAAVAETYHAATAVNSWRQGFGTP